MILSMLKAAYPNLEPELADTFSIAIPIALRYAPTADEMIELRSELYAIDPLFDRSGTSSATVFPNHDPLTLRFPVWYAVLTMAMTGLILFFLGRPWFRSTRKLVRNWRTARALNRV